jgi:transcriptional regulator with XRE-family HTH domain
MVADRIKELREKSKYSQSLLAKKINVTRSAVNAWEMGISIPSTQFIIELSQLFRVSTDYLLGIQSESILSLDGLTIEEIQILYGLIDYFRDKKESHETSIIN